MLDSFTGVVDFTKVQIGFDTAAFISILASTGIFYSEYRKRRKADMKARFVEGARAAVIAAINSEVKEFAIAKTRLHSASYHLSAANAALTRQDQLHYMIGAGTYLDDGYHQRSYHRDNLNIKQFRIFLRAANIWNEEILSLTRSVITGEKLLSTYLRLLTDTNLEKRFDKVVNKVEERQIIAIVNDIEKCSYSTVEFFELIEVMFDAYCNRGDEKSSIFEMRERLCNDLTPEQLDLIKDVCSEDLKAVRENIDSASEHEDWIINVLDEYCERVIKDPLVFFTEIIAIYIASVTTEIPEKLDRLSSFQSELLLTFLME